MPTYDLKIAGKMGAFSYTADALPKDDETITPDRADWSVRVIETHGDDTAGTIVAELEKP